MPGGDGISWNDDIDLSEYELWTNGEPITNAERPPAVAGERGVERRPSSRE